MMFWTTLAAISIGICMINASALPLSTDKPAFCHDIGCPDFTVVNKTAEYEERSYVSTQWVSTTLTGMDYDVAGSTMFQKLFQYISGKNAQSEKVAMTSPVLVSVIPGQGPACENNFTMSFFVSPTAGAPPAPSDSTVFLSRLPSQRVFISSFGGFATMDTYLQNAETLANALVKDNQAFVKDYFYTAGYDGPYRITGRHNEVWFVAQ